MSVIRVHKTKNFTVMSNHHFKEKKMSLKSKGLLSLMLSLPDDWDYSIPGLATLSKDGKDSVMSALIELEKFGYLTRTRLTNEKGQFQGIEYNIYEEPQTKNPTSEKATLENPTSASPISEDPPQLNTNHIKNLYNELLMVLNTEDKELVELYKDFIIMRDEMGEKMSTSGLRALIRKCKKLSYANPNVEKLILENAIINNWKDVYVPRATELSKLNQRFVKDFIEVFGDLE